MPQHLFVELYIFVLAVFVGFQLISKVPSVLHTPLMSATNAIHGIVLANEPSSPLYGMPILNVDQAQRVVVIKRGMSPGFAGIDNPLYVNPKTNMLFGDAKESVSALVRALDAV